jgi:rhodanese-related sulfurtransferase
MPIQSISPHALHTWLTSGEATLVDVREPAEFAGGHIPQARSIPLGSLSPATLPKDGKKLVVQCKAGRRSETACGVLQRVNPELTVYSLEGGLDAWAAAGLPVIGNGKRILPLDRQVQLAIGLVLLATSAAGYLTGSLGALIVTGLIGCGLTVAGTTGFCGLARVLAHAPWNRA